VLHRKFEHSGVLHGDGLDGENSRAEAIGQGHRFVVKQITENRSVVDRDAMFCFRAGQVWEYLSIVSADAQKAVRRLFRRVI